MHGVNHVSYLIKGLDTLFFIGGLTKPEVVNIPSFTRSRCVVPDFPHLEYYGYVGTRTDNGPMLCGGKWVDEVYFSATPACFVLTKNGTWVQGKSMKTVRQYAASVETSVGWWVTGKLQRLNIIVIGATTGVTRPPRTQDLPTQDLPT